MLNLMAKYASSIFIQIFYKGFGLMKNAYTAMILATAMSMCGVLMGSDCMKRLQPPKAPRLQPMDSNFDEVPPFMLDNLWVPTNFKIFLMSNGVHEDAVSGFGDYLLKFMFGCFLLEQFNDTDVESGARQMVNSDEHPRVARALVARMVGLKNKRLLIDVLNEKIKYSPGTWSRWWPKRDNALSAIAQYCDAAVLFLQARR